MKLTFKDLKQQKFVIEAEASETIAEIKAKIEKDKGWDPAQQKLIYSGKILQDGNTVASYNIEEKGFIVCMVQKPKTAPAASSSSSSKATPQTPAPATAQTPAVPAAPAPVSATTTSNPPATPSPAPQTPSNQPARFGDASTLALGAERNAAIANMESMGFERADIDRAMRAAFFNPDRAVEYLLNGIPENVVQEEAAPSRAAAAASPTSTPSTGGNFRTPATTATPGSNPRSGAVDPSGDEPVNLFEAAAQAGQRGSRGAGAGSREAGAGLGGVGNLDFLRNNPQFQQLRQVVQQQPQMLEHILQQVNTGNPQLAQLISERPEEFLQLLAEDNDDDAALPPGAQAISVTEEEREAIERLCRLGFERDLVIQAYFACDKNEELAANFLFDQPDEDEQ